MITHRDYAPLILFVVACVLILPNLGDRNLWQDEAETALVAKNVLRTGLPLGWDGRQLVTQLSGAEMTGSFLWAWTPWLMHYVAAFGMLVAGATSFGARWPFALTGCLTFPLFYAVVLRITGDRRLTLVASALLLSSVQYLLLMRQCRYYALLPAFFLAALAGYQATSTRRGVFLMSVGLLGLFHSNFVSCAIVASGLALHVLVFRRDAQTVKRLTVTGVILLAGSVPWLLATGVLDRTSGRSEFAMGFLGVCLMSNAYLCPWLVAAAFGVTAAVRRIRVQPIDTLALCMFAPMFVFLPAFLWPNPRYVSFLLPVGAIVLARVIVELHKVGRLFPYVLGGVSILTNLLVVPLPALFPVELGRDAFGGELPTGSDALTLGVFRSELGGYAYELTHSARGPDEALASFINSHCAPDDLIFMTNEPLSAMFHTRRRFAGVAASAIRDVRVSRASPSYVWDATQARWFILRPSGSSGSLDVYRSRIVAALGRKGMTVEKSFVVDVDDVRWINRETVAAHLFKPGPDRQRRIEVLQLSPGGGTTRNPT